MRAAAIRRLVETQTLAQLEEAEQALLSGRELPFAIEGDSRGEQLTHVLAASFIQAYMKSREASFAAASRVFFQRVREAVS